MVPATKYARNGDVHLAYQVIGDADKDLLDVPGFISHVEMIWERPSWADMLRRLSSFRRLIIFDKRGGGLSDPVPSAPTLEERVADMRAVVTAAGSERHAIYAVSEGVPASILYAATYPEAVEALILYGGMARTTEADDYPWATPRDALIEARDEFLAPEWGSGASLDTFRPSEADDPEVVAWMARFERASASPGMIFAMYELSLSIDVRSLLPSVQVPTLVIHRHGDRVVNVGAGRYIAEHIPGARLVELDGRDHQLGAGDTDEVIDEIEEFLTGVRGRAPSNRVVTTVLFTDIVSSTERATELGDHRWSELLESHQAAMRGEVERHGGRWIKSTGDGLLATFDGPAQGARCGIAMTEGARALGTPIRVGIHTGECDVAGGDVSGIAVHLASRVCNTAESDEVLVTSTVRDLVVGSELEFVYRGVHELKGIPGSWTLLAAAIGRRLTVN